jgi:hypothetical protein
VDSGRHEGEARDWVKECLEKTSESKEIEFKSSFDPKDELHVLNIVREIVAIANSGGGYIVFGVDNSGNPTGDDLKILQWDPAKITDQINKYTSVQFCGFEIQRAEKDGKQVAVMKIEEVNPPLVFTKEGEYTDRTDPSRKKCAFHRGTIYYRHGTKTEPGDQNDIRESYDRFLERRRKKVIEVLEAAPGVKIEVLTHAPGKTGVSATTDDRTERVARIKVEDYYIYALKDIVEKINAQIRGKKINRYDIKILIKVYDLESNDMYMKKISYYGNGSFRYSEEFLKWLLDEVKRDPSLFQKAREKYKQSKGKQDNSGQ